MGPKYDYIKYGGSTKTRLASYPQSKNSAINLLHILHVLVLTHVSDVVMAVKYELGIDTYKILLY